VIDRGLAHPWPQEVVDAARRFCQGTVISVPPMFYGRVADHAVWRTPVDSDVRFGDIELVTLPADIPYGIITTQTCDVAEARTPRRPWIQVAPVYQLTAARETTPPDYLVPLPGGALGEGTWFADLRIEIPVEKSILVGREPIQVFDSEDWEIRFAEILGRRRDRAALHEHINSCLYQPWQAKVSTNRNRARRVLAELHAVRLQVETGSRAFPRSVRVHFISEGGPLSEDAQEWLDQWWDRAHQEAEQADPALLLQRNRIHDGNVVDVVVYDTLIPMVWW